MAAFAYCLQVFCGIAMVIAGLVSGISSMGIWLGSVLFQKFFRELAVEINSSAAAIAVEEFGRNGTSMTLIPITIFSFLFCLPWCMRTSKSIFVVGFLNAAAMLVGIIGILFNYVKGRAGGQFSIVYYCHSALNLTGVMLFTCYLVCLCGYMLGLHLRNREKKAEADRIVALGYAPLPGYGATQPAAQPIPGYAAPDYAAPQAQPVATSYGHV